MRRAFAILMFGVLVSCDGGSPSVAECAAKDAIRTNISQSGQAHYVCLLPQSV